MQLRTLIFVCAAFLAPGLASAETTTAPTLLPDSLSLPVLDGSTVPDDCMYPSTIADPNQFELACVTVPRDRLGTEISARYIGMLGQRGWHEGSYVSGGFTAVHTGDNGCAQVLNIFPSDYPPSEHASSTVVIWFALERAQHCDAPARSQ
jgi:hypothetical protein